MRTALLLPVMALGLLACNDYDDDVTKSDALDIGVRRDVPAPVDASDVPDVPADVPDIPMDVTGAVTVAISTVTTTLTADHFSAVGAGDLTVSQLPTLGQLQLEGAALAVDAVVPVVDLEADKLTYVRTDPTAASDVLLVTRDGISIDVAINVSAVEQTLTPSRDATLYQDDGGLLASGIGNGLFVGKTGGGSLRRTVLAFDVATAVPAGSLVIGAELRLTVNKGQGASLDVGAYRVSAEWAEGPSKAEPTSGSMNGAGGGVASMPGDVTWLHRTFDTVLWASPGGDFEATPSATFATANMRDVQQAFALPGLVADIQGWADGTLDDHGWLLKAAVDTAQGVRRFGSREGPDSPQLVIQTLAP